MCPILAELFGTMLLVILGDGVVANVALKQTKGHGSGWIVITAGWAFAVTFAVYCTNAISGAHLNPAVTIGLAAIGKFAWAGVPGYVAAQVAGGFLGGVVVWLAYLGPRIAHAVLPIRGKGGSDWGYAWVPVVGPVIGGIAGAVFYQALWPAA